MFKQILCFFLPISLFSTPIIELGVDQFFKNGHERLIKNKKVALLTNQTGRTSNNQSTIELFLERAKNYQVIALFCPEHGLDGKAYAFEKIKDGSFNKKLPIYSLHGSTRRPTKKMLTDIDVIIFDIQDIGTRAYTYATTLFYVMEEAAKYNISVIVLDRPNPINGLIVDGPMLESKFRSFIGYINVPYCHGMTIGELAGFFNHEYNVNCRLKVIPMKGWKREMSFEETGLQWIPPSPNIPESTTPFFSATTGILGELGIVNIGIGYTLPFKLVGAPWINADQLAAALNKQKIPGAYFLPFHYRPFYGSLKGKDCHGVLIRVTNMRRYQPLSVQYLLMGILKSLYPQETKGYLEKVNGNKKRLFCLANGNDEIYRLMLNERYAAWKMIAYQKSEREQFKETRAKYLLY